MTLHYLKERKLSTILLGIFINFQISSSADCGAKISNEDESEGCCYLKPGGEAICESVKFASFPPFPPGKEGCKEWCGSGPDGNSKRFTANEVKKFTVTDSCFHNFNKDALREYLQIEEISFLKCGLPSLENELFYFASWDSSVKVLSITESKIARIQPGAFYGLPRLEKLSLSLNQLTNLPAGVFDKLPSLRKLYLSGNRFSGVDLNLFKNLKNLEILDLSHNPLHPIGVFPKLWELTDLDLSHASLNTIPVETFSQLPALNKLELNDNHLKSLPVGVFSQNHALALVYLNNNQLEDIPGEVFGSLCNLETLNLENNKLSTPKVAYMAVVFDNKNRPVLSDLMHNDLSGNPWKCEELNDDLKEYALFVNTVHKLKRTQSVRHGLPEYINIECADTGNLLVDPSRKSFNRIIDSIAESQRAALLRQNDCMFQNETHLPNNPACPFISATCANLGPITSSPEFETLKEREPMFYYFIGGGLVGVIIVLLIAVRRAQNPSKRKRNVSETTSVSTDASPLSPLSSRSVEVSEPSVSHFEVGAAPNLRPLRPDTRLPFGPATPIAPGVFSFPASVCSADCGSIKTFQSNNDNCDVTDDSVSRRSETVVKEIASDEGRNSTRPGNAHITNSNTLRGPQNNYQSEQRGRLPLLGDESGYAAANFSPDDNPGNMSGYAAMSPLAGAPRIRPGVLVMLPCNEHRRLPSLPVAYVAVSHHEYESIKTNPITDTRNPIPCVKQPDGQYGDHGSSEDENGYLKPDLVGARSLEEQENIHERRCQTSSDISNYNPSTVKFGNQISNASCLEDEDGYLLSHVARQTRNNLRADTHASVRTSTLQIVNEIRETAIENRNSEIPIHEVQEAERLDGGDQQILQVVDDERNSSSNSEHENVYLLMNDVRHFDNRPLSQQLLLDNMESDT